MIGEAADSITRQAEMSGGYLSPPSYPRLKLSSLKLFITNFIFWIFYFVDFDSQSEIQIINFILVQNKLEKTGPAEIVPILSFRQPG